MKVRVVVRPSGLLNGRDWPEVGEELDLSDAAAEGMIEAGLLEAVTEKRPASKRNVENRKGD